MSIGARGMVDLSDLQQPRFSSTTVTTATTASTTASTTRVTGSNGVLGSFAAEISKPVFRSVSGADCFARIPGLKTSESELWSLLADLLRDQERSHGYSPSSIGLEQVSDTRRWNVSQHATIQHLLLATPIFRRMVVVLRWLERTYKRHASVNLWSAKSPGEKALLQEHVFSFIRSGQIQRGIDAAVIAKDSDYAAMLTNVQLHTVKEPWFTGTALVDLFGEYSGGQSNSSWANNSHRLATLSSLFEFSCNPHAAQPCDVIITAALSGNWDILQSAFPSDKAPWQDVLWCDLRCALVLAFAKALKNAGQAIPSSAYCEMIDRVCPTSPEGSPSSWIQEAISSCSLAIHGHLASYLHQKPPALELEEELQIRLVLMFLSPHTVDFPLDSLAVANSDGRLVSFFATCLTCARNEELIRRDFDSQQRMQCDALELLVRRTVEQVSTVADVWLAAEWIVSAARYVRDTSRRTKVYSTLLLAARNRGHVLGLGADFIEEQEVKLVGLIRQRDTASDVQDSLVRSLKQMMSESSVMLTRDREAEGFLWKCLNAPPSAARSILSEGLELCAFLWRKTNSKAENALRLGAIADTVRIMKQHTIAKCTSQTEAGFQDLLHQVSFWEAACEISDLSEKHLACCVSLMDATQQTDRTVAFSQQRLEQQLYGQLIVQADRSLALLPAMLPRYAGDAHCSCAAAIKAFSESSTMSLCVSTAAGSPMAQLQHVMRFVDGLNSQHAFSKLPTALARALYDAVNLTTAKCNHRLLKAQVEDTRRSSQTS